MQENLINKYEYRRFANLLITLCFLPVLLGNQYCLGFESDSSKDELDETLTVVEKNNKSSNSGTLELSLQESRAIAESRKPGDPTLANIFDRMLAFEPGGALEDMSRVICTIDRKNLADTKTKKRLRLSRALSWAGRAFLYDDNPLPARIAFQQALTLCPDDQLAICDLANANRNLHRYEDEKKLIDQIESIEESAREPATWLCLARYYTRIGNWSAMDTCIDNAEAKMGAVDLLPVYLTKSRAAILKGFGPRGAEYMHKAAENCENPYVREIIESDACAMELDSNGQKLHLSRASEIYPQDPVWMIKMANYHEGQMQQEEAYNLYYRSVNCKRHTRTAFISLARHYSNRKNYQAALHTMQYIKKLMPSSVRIELALASIMQDRNEHDKAIEIIDAAIELDPHNFRAYEQKASLLKIDKRLLEALECLQNYSQNHKDSWHSRFLAGEILTRLERVDEARKIFSEALSLLPKDSSQWNVLAMHLSRKAFALEGWQKYKQGDIAGAIMDARFCNSLKFTPKLPMILSLVNIRPGKLVFAKDNPLSDPMSYAALADMLLEMKELDASEKEYRQAIELSPNDPDLHSYLLHVLSLKGDWVAAAKENFVLSDQMMKRIPGKIMDLGNQRKEETEEDD